MTAAGKIVFSNSLDKADWTGRVLPIDHFAAVDVDDLPGDIGSVF